MIIEEWRVIPDFPWYEASSRGRIRSIPREGKTSGKVLTAYPDKTGYARISLRTAQGVKKRCKVATLIALTFIGPRPEKAEVCHYDDDPSNDAVENLRYDTSSARKRGLTHLSRPVTT